jgi:hypothetical protein
MAFDYPDFVQRVLLHDEAMRRPLPTDPENPEMVIRIREATDEEILPDSAMRNAEFVPLLRGGLFYFHDSLVDAIRLIDGVPGALADYWRHMVFRRMGEFEVARTYGRRAGELPPFQLMLRMVSEDSPNMSRQANWDGYLLAQLYEQFRFGDADLEVELRRLQRVEFDQMYRYTFREASGE